MSPTAVRTVADRDGALDFLRGLLVPGDVVLVKASRGIGLDMLAGLPGRRIAVLGEMLELGRGAVTGHREVGTAAAATCDLLIVVGAGASGIAAGAKAAGLDPSRILEARDAEAALDLLRARLRDGDVVLVKASRGVELDQLVEALRAELSR